MSYIVPKASDDRSLLYRDRDYYVSMPAYAHRITQISITKDDEVLKSFTSFIIEAISTNDEEAVETTMTAEGSKLRVGDRLIRNVTLSGTLLDSDAEGQSGHSAWLKFYDEARLSQISESRRLVKIETTDLIFYGGLMRYEIQLTSDEPNRLTLSTTMVCVRVEIPTSVTTTKVAGSDFYGKVSYEGLSNIGLIGPLVTNPITTRIPTTFESITDANQGVSFGATSQSISDVALSKKLNTPSAAAADRSSSRFRA